VRDDTPTVRREYYDDPKAPTANTIVPGVTAVVTNETGEILLQRRWDNGDWGLPGGAVKLGESAAQAVVREVREETGIEVKPTGIVGIYSDPRHVIERSTGEVRQQFSICFTAVPVGKGVKPVPGVEAKEAGFFPAERLDELQMTGPMRLRIDHFLEPGDRPHFT
jgi:ADP-ribose pyrophosphatase YjhB (NUDIX family)